MNSTETKTELPIQNAGLQFYLRELNLLRPQAMAHYNSVAMGIQNELDTIRTRLEAVEKANGELVELIQRAMLNTRNDAILLGRLGLGDSEHIKETQWWKDAEKATAEALKGEGK